MSENMNQNDEVMTVELTFDNDETVECAVVCVYEAAGNEYIALLPVDQAEDEEPEVLIYRYSETEDGGAIMDNIDDDDEYEAAADAFDAWVAEQE